MNWASFISVFLLGLMGSLHCIGMCGPLQSFLGKASWQFKFLYHYGRYMAYVMVGILFCMTGYTLELLSLQKYFSIFIGITLILSVVFPFLLPKISFSRITNFLFSFAKVQNASFKFFMMGFANGILPCGLVYMSATQSVIGMNLMQTLGLMFLFFAGTLPALLGLRYVYRFLEANPFQPSILKPLLTIALGILLVCRGLNAEQMQAHKSTSQMCTSTSK